MNDLLQTCKKVSGRYKKVIDRLIGMWLFVVRNEIFFLKIELVLTWDLRNFGGDR